MHVRVVRSGALVGEGAFGKVYEGFMVDTAQTLAAKRIPVPVDQVAAARTRL